MFWTPERQWERQDAYVIGGGASLRSFDFNRLRGLNTIGCNDAFRLGDDIIKLCIFGDASWWHKCRIDLEKFHNPIISVAPSLIPLNTPKLKHMKRQREGLHDGFNLGWNLSTGAAAINLAISLGAKQIFLLGFDLCAIENKTHWHGYRARPTQDHIFERFIKGFAVISNHLHRYQVRVFHVIDGKSRLPFFNHMTFEGFDYHLNTTERFQDHVEKEKALNYCI